MEELAGLAALATVALLALSGYWFYRGFWWLGGGPRRRQEEKVIDRLLKYFLIALSRNDGRVSMTDMTAELGRLTAPFVVTEDLMRRVARRAIERGYVVIEGWWPSGDYCLTYQGRDFKQAHGWS